MSGIVIEELCRTVRDGGRSVTILDRLSLRISQGSCVVIEGISGSGKTTLLHLIAGLDKPDSGRILIGGVPVIKLPDRQLSAFRRSHIAMIFQHFELLEHLSTADNVGVPLITAAMPKKEMKARIRHCMELANIAHKAATPVSKLSGGERQRVAIARALACDPGIILCDEPTANLDRENRLRFIERIGQLHAMGKTILIATHDPLFRSLPFEHRVVRMENGAILP